MSAKSPPSSTCQHRAGGPPVRQCRSGRGDRHRRSGHHRHVADRLNTAATLILLYSNRTKVGIRVKNEYFFISLAGKTNDLRGY